MHTDEKEVATGLENGQLWKVDEGYVYIVELGRRLIHYKMLRHPEQKATLTRLIGIEALLNFLRRSEAVLVHCPAAE